MMDNGRPMSVTAMQWEIDARVKEIADVFGPFMRGTRVLLLLQRKKEGGNTREDRRRHVGFAATDEKEIMERIRQLVTLQMMSKEPLRVYMSVNPRDIRKANYEFRRRLLQDECDGMVEVHGKVMQDRWISALMATNADKGVQDKYFILDVDDTGDDVMGKVLRRMDELGVVEQMRYRTKNGWHVVVDPFRRDLWDVEGVGVQVDGLLLLSF